MAVFNPVPIVLHATYKNPLNPSFNVSFFKKSTLYLNNFLVFSLDQDLIVFSEDEPPNFAVQSTFPTRAAKEELATDKKAATRTPWKASM